MESVWETVVDLTRAVFLPLVVAWIALFVVDALITAFVTMVFGKSESNKPKQGNDETETPTYGVFYGNGPIPINNTLALLIGSIMLAFLVPIVGGVVGLTVLWDFIDRGLLSEYHQNPLSNISTQPDRGDLRMALS
jgi:hypothetical protein